MRSATWRIGAVILAVATAAAGTGIEPRGVDVDVTAQGVVSATSVFDGNFLPENVVDGNPNTNWFSDGDTGGDTEVFTWTRRIPGDLSISRLETDPETFMGGGDFGFATSRVRLFDAAGDLRFSGPLLNNNAFRVNLTQIFSGIAASRIEIELKGHQDPICGGFSQLRIFARQESLPPAPTAVPVPGGASAGDGVGQAVAADGNLYAVGVPGASGGRGRVIVFRVEGQALVEDAIIEVPGNRSVARFGAALALDEGRLLIGAPGQTLGKGNTLQAALYERTQAGWTQKGEFSAEGSGDEFGASVDLEGSTMVVGAPSDSAGAVYVFEFNGSSIGAMERLEPVGESAGARFGNAVGIDRGRLAVGAPGGVIGQVTSGSVHLYEQVAGNLSGINRIGRRNGSGSSGDGAFGTSVALAGNTMIVGAPGEDDLAGAAYIFDAQAFTESARLTLPAGSAGDAFGTSVAADTAGLAVGAPGFGSNGGAFQYTGSGEFITPILGEVGQAGVGSAVAVTGGGFLAGAPISDGDTGAAIVSRDPNAVFADDFE